MMTPLTSHLTEIALALVVLILATAWVSYCVWLGSRLSRRSREARRKAAARAEEMQQDFDQRKARVEAHLREKF